MSHLADAEDAESALTHRQAARWDEVLKDHNDWAKAISRLASQFSKHGGRTLSR